MAEVQRYKIPEALFQAAETVRMTWAVTLPAERSFEETLDPVFWSHVARKIDMKFQNFIEVYRADRTLVGQLYVRGILGSNVYVAVIDKPIEFGKQTVATKGLTPVWNEGKKGWDVVRAEDKQVVASGEQFVTREQAEQWIAQQRKTLAA